MKKLKIIIPLITAVIVLIISAAAIKAKYQPLVFKEEIPYYGEKIIVELRLNYDTYNLKVYKISNFPIFKFRKTLLEKENVANTRHGNINTKDIKITGEANYMDISIPTSHGYHRNVRCFIT